MVNEKQPLSLRQIVEHLETNKMPIEGTKVGMSSIAVNDTTRLDRTLTLKGKVDQKEGYGLVPVADEVAGYHMLADVRVFEIVK
jgi:hypothetical protein